MTDEMEWEERGAAYRRAKLALDRGATDGELAALLAAVEDRREMERRGQGAAEGLAAAAIPRPPAAARIRR